MGSSVTTAASARRPRRRRTGAPSTRAITATRGRRSSRMGTWRAADRRRARGARRDRAGAASDGDPARAGRAPRRPRRHPRRGRARARSRRGSAREHPAHPPRARDPRARARPPRRAARRGADQRVDRPAVDDHRETEVHERADTDDERRVPRLGRERVRFGDDAEPFPQRRREAVERVRRPAARVVRHGERARDGLRAPAAARSRPTTRSASGIGSAELDSGLRPREVARPAVPDPCPTRRSRSRRCRPRAARRRPARARREPRR